MPPNTTTEAIASPTSNVSSVNSSTATEKVSTSRQFKKSFTKVTGIKDKKKAYLKKTQAELETKNKTKADELETTQHEIRESTLKKEVLESDKEKLTIEHKKEVDSVLEKTAAEKKGRAETLANSKKKILHIETTTSNKISKIQTESTKTQERIRKDMEGVIATTKKVQAKERKNLEEKMTRTVNDRDNFVQFCEKELDDLLTLKNDAKERLRKKLIGESSVETRIRLISTGKTGTKATAAPLVSPTGVNYGFDDDVDTDASSDDDDDSSKSAESDEKSIYSESDEEKDEDEKIIAPVVVPKTKAKAVPKKETVPAPKKTSKVAPVVPKKETVPAPKKTNKAAPVVAAAAVAKTKAAETAKDTPTEKAKATADDSAAVKRGSVDLAEAVVIASTAAGISKVADVVGSDSDDDSSMPLDQLLKAMGEVSSTDSDEDDDEEEEEVKKEKTLPPGVVPPAVIAIDKTKNETSPLPPPPKKPTTTEKTAKNDAAPAAAAAVATAAVVATADRSSPPPTTTRTVAARKTPASTSPAPAATVVAAKTAAPIAKKSSDDEAPKDRSRGATAAALTTAAVAGGAAVAMATAEEKEEEIVVPPVTEQEEEIVVPPVEEEEEIIVPPAVEESKAVPPSKETEETPKIQINPLAALANALSAPSQDEEEIDPSTPPPKPNVFDAFKMYSLERTPGPTSASDEKPQIPAGMFSSSDEESQEKPIADDEESETSEEQEKVDPKSLSLSGAFKAFAVTKKDTDKKKIKKKHQKMNVQWNEMMGDDGSYEDEYDGASTAIMTESSMGSSYGRVNHQKTTVSIYDAFKTYSVDKSSQPEPIVVGRVNTSTGTTPMRTASKVKSTSVVTKALDNAEKKMKETPITPKTTNKPTQPKLTMTTRSSNDRQAQIPAIPTNATESTSFSDEDDDVPKPSIFGSESKTPVVVDNKSSSIHNAFSMYSIERRPKKGNDKPSSPKKVFDDEPSPVVISEKHQQPVVSSSNNIPNPHGKISVFDAFDNFTINSKQSTPTKETRKVSSTHGFLQPQQNDQQKMTKKSIAATTKQRQVSSNPNSDKVVVDCNQQ